MIGSFALLAFGLLLAEPGSGDAAKEVQAVAEKALAPLPGDKAFLWTELTAEGPKPLYGLRQDERFAVGSSFKLYILGTLAVDLNAEQRQLANLMTLQPDWVGPPSSEMAGWPMGSPVTVHTVALKMISISDNTATDHLLHYLGRERIEKQMAAMGHNHPEWNRPLLSTREMVMLRDKNTGLVGREYQELDEAGRRKLLADKFSGRPDYANVEFDAAAYSLAEWYATPMDMARAMAWLKHHSETDSPAHPVRGILAVETKLPHDAKAWPYVGFKGGSEDQLICGNWLLQHRSGSWHTLHLYCNSPKEKVDPQKLVKALEQLFGAIEKSMPEEGR